MWKYVSDEAKNLILSKRLYFYFLDLLEKDRFKRIAIEDVLQHPWILKRSKQIEEIRAGADLLT